MGRITLLKLTTVCLISSTVPAAVALTAAIDAARSIGLLSRAPDSCGGSNYLRCNLPGFPSTFCCPSGTVCIPFNNAASVVCCPAGQDCKTIAPIACDVTLQDATLNPLSQLHSTDLKGSLQACGNKCCPKGYTCQNSQCIMTADVKPSTVTRVSNKPTASPTIASSTNIPKPSSSALSTSVTTASPQSSVPTTPAKEAQPDNKFPVLAIIVGFLPGLLLGIILTVSVVLCLRHRHRRRHQNTGSQKGSEFGSSHAATVSEPIFHPGSNAFRTDFLRRESIPNQRPSPVKSLFSRSSSYRSRDGIGRSLRTPVRTPDLTREPSMESIKIYSPPNGGLGSPHGGMGRPTTTFTDMMADAGFRPGEPYLVDTPPRGTHR